MTQEARPNTSSTCDKTALEANAKPAPPGRNSPTGWIDAAVAHHEAPLTLFVLRIVGDSETARDVVQEAFLRLLEQDPATAKTNIAPHVAEWLYTVCRHRALDVRRKEKRVRALPDDAARAIAHDAPEPMEVMAEAESASRVLKMLAHLPPNQQEVIRLKFQAGLSYKEISGVTRLSVTNVGFLLHTGLKTLREKMSPAPGHPSR